MKLIAPLIFISFAFAGCLSDIIVKDYKNVPRQVDLYIHESRINPISISKVEYSEPSSVGYLIIPDCCDQFIILVDSKGNRICAPSGGFTGGGDGLCPNFYSDLKKTETVWESSK